MLLAQRWWCLWVFSPLLLVAAEQLALVEVFLEQRPGVSASLQGEVVESGWASRSSEDRGELQGELQGDLQGELQGELLLVSRIVRGRGKYKQTNTWPKLISSFKANMKTFYSLTERERVDVM